MIAQQGNVAATEESRPPVAGWKRWTCCLICFAAGAIAFWPTLLHSFVYDDHPIVEDNWIVNAPDAWYRFLVTSYWPPPSPREKQRASGDKLYRPLTIGTFRLERLVCGRNPMVHHATNTILHAVVSVLVCALALRVWRSALAALLAGLLFAVHPIHADAVAPVVGRSEVLAGVFSTWLLLRYVRPVSLSGRALIRFQLVSTLLFAGAVFSKEHAWFVWPVLLALEWYHRRALPAAQRPGLRLWLGDLARRGHLGFAYVSAAFFFMRFYLFGMHYRRLPVSLPYWANPLAQADVTACLLTPFRLLWLAVRMFVDPSLLSPLWNPNALVPAETLRELDVWGGLLAALAIVGVMVWGLWRGRLIWVWLFAFAAFMAIPLHFLPMASWLFAERWLYMPSVAVAIMLAGAVRPFGVRLATAGVCLAILLLPYTWSYAAAWRSDESMNRYVLRDHPDNLHAAINLAYAYLLEKQYDLCLYVAAGTAERFPDAWEPHNLMSQAYAALGDAERAKEEATACGVRLTRQMLLARP